MSVDAFKAVVAERQKEKREEQERKDNKNWSADFLLPETFQIGEGVDSSTGKIDFSVFRMMGQMVPRLNVTGNVQPGDNRDLLWSKVLNDTGKKYVHIFWPHEIDSMINRKS